MLRQVKCVKGIEASMKSVLELGQLQSDPRPSLDRLGDCDPIHDLCMSL